MAPLNDMDFQVIDGVCVSSPAREKFAGFEKNYLDVRQKEKRILNLEEIRKLPYVDKESPDRLLWELRRKNIFRFLDYLSKKNKPLAILDIGCGNGFFTHLMSKQGHNVAGLDVNLYELRQAAGAFNGAGIEWYYLDIMSESFPDRKFDMITFCCSFHYFKEPVSLLERCRKMLTENGEIHIIDSPFYSEKTKEKARENSLEYYQSMGVGEMINFYSHNAFDILKSYRYTLKYKPMKILNRLFKIKDSPFPWIMITE